MSTIKVSCTDQVLAITDSPVLASGGVNENFIEFDFCEQWDGFGKTCVFFRERGEYSYSILDSSDKCVIPPEATAGAGRMYFGVVGVNETGTVRTSELLGYRIVAGAVTEVPDPTPALYQQILGQLAGLREDVTNAIENVNGIAQQAAAAATATATAAAQQAETAAASVTETAQTSEAWAVGKRGGVEVPSSDDAYHNNAKYWAAQAANAAGGGVMSFNGRSGTVEPLAGDYTANQVGAIPSTAGAVETANLGDGVVTSAKLANDARYGTEIAISTPGSTPELSWGNALVWVWGTSMTIKLTAEVSALLPPNWQCRLFANDPFTFSWEGIGTPVNAAKGQTESATGSIAVPAKKYIDLKKIDNNIWIFSGTYAGHMRYDGTTEPSADLGVDGDEYLMYS